MAPSKPFALHYDPNLFRNPLVRIRNCTIFENLRTFLDYTLERISPDPERSECFQTLSVINTNDSDAAQARTTLLVHDFGGKPAQSSNLRALSALWATGGDLRIFTDSWT